MTFQYFIGIVIVTFTLNFTVMALLDGVIGIFLNATGGKNIKVVVKNDGFNY